mgnify:CR=1 FL=1
MSVDLMISALRQGKTGGAILEILNAITSDEELQDSIQVNEPTLEEIQF